MKLVDNLKDWNDCGTGTVFAIFYMVGKQADAISSRSGKPRGGKELLKHSPKNVFSMAAFSALVETSTLFRESIQGVSGKDTEVGNQVTK